MTRKILAVLGLVVLIGCASFQSTTGKFLASTAQTADVAMKGWALYVVSNDVSTNAQAGVRSAYGLYQRSMLVASNAWEVSLTGTNQTVWLVASNALFANQKQLVDLINSLQLNPKVP
jgi:hypothetical protein